MVGTISLWGRVFLVIVVFKSQSAAQPYTAACSLPVGWERELEGLKWENLLGWDKDNSTGKAMHSLGCSSTTPWMRCHWLSLLTGGEVWETEEILALCRFCVSVLKTLCTAQMPNKTPYHPLWRKLVLFQSNPVQRCLCQQSVLHFRSGSKDAQWYLEYL